MASMEEVLGAIKQYAAGTLRGATTDTLGAPVDLVNLAISPITKAIGIHSDNPVMGSRWLREKAGLPLEDTPLETAAGMVTPGGAVKAMIVGAARLGKAVNAETMAQQFDRRLHGGGREANMDAIFGWAESYQDGDKKWKSVISDADAKINTFVLDVRNTDTTLLNYVKTVDQVIDHPKLFQLYPELRTTPIHNMVGQKNSAEFSGDKIFIAPQDNPEKLRSTVLHELQHAVQQTEGFSRGTNPTVLRKPHLIKAEERLRNIGITKMVENRDAVDRFQRRIADDKQVAFEKYLANPGEQEARFTEFAKDSPQQELNQTVLELLKDSRHPQNWFTKDASLPE